MSAADSRVCTCTGSCKGAAGLGAGWTCALLSGQPTGRVLPGTAQVRRVGGYDPGPAWRLPLGTRVRVVCRRIELRRYKRIYVRVQRTFVAPWPPQAVRDFCATVVGVPQKRFVYITFPDGHTVRKVGIPSNLTGIDEAGATAPERPR